MVGYDVARVCLNGHLINDSVRRNPGRSTQKCVQCGADAIEVCPECNEPLRGDYHSELVLRAISTYRRATYCGRCGEALPWLSASLKSSRELLELSGVEESVVESLMGQLQHLVADTPQTEVATERWRRFLARSGDGTAKLLRKVLANIVTDAVKSDLGL